LRANGPVVIEDAESVRKSYPDFWDDLRSVGASVSLSD
jgi:3-phosphoshikimate 1-carboxyvinyltransferase